MKLLNFDRVLCISPHPDDVEYSMYGTIAKHTETNFDILCLCSGGDFDNSTGNNRFDEVIRLWEKSVLNNINIFTSPYEFIKDITEDTWINYIESNFIKKYKYDAIFLPNDHDSHFEHRFVAGFGDALIRSVDISTIQYFTPSTQDTWNPNFYVDISKSIDRKKNILKNFESQQDKYYFTNDVIDSFHSDFQCRKKGMKFIEKYKITNYFIGEE